MKPDDHTNQSNKSQEITGSSRESLTLAEERQRLAERLGRLLARYWLASQTASETTMTTVNTASGHTDPASNGVR